MDSEKKISKSIDLFIFDWDGTLNSMRLTMRANEAIKRAFHIWNRDSSMKNFKDGDANLKKRLKEEERKNDIMTYTFELFLNFSKPKLHNDTIEMLKELRRKKKKVAIFTNGRSQRVVRELQYLGITNYFDSIVSGREIGAIKPNPSGLNAILKELHQKPEKTLYAGDMVDDIFTARQIHVKTCGIASGFDSYHKLKSVHPDYLFRNIEDFTRHL